MTNSKHPIAQFFETFGVKKRKWQKLILLYLLVAYPFTTMAFMWLLSEPRMPIGLLFVLGALMGMVAFVLGHIATGAIAFALYYAVRFLIED